MFEKMVDKRGQATVFIIIGIVLIAGVILFFIFRGNLFGSSISPELAPVYNSYVSCMEGNLLAGISVAESQGGYIYLPDFEPGSSYMPFSSQLDFLGNPIPYWYYVSRNGVERNQVPTVIQIQNQLAQYLEENARDCRFDDFYRQGFEIYQGEPKVKITVKDNSVQAVVDMDFEIYRNDESARIRTHNINVNSNLGNLFNSAKKVYDYQQSTLFLENYAVDTLRLYAPVDGVEISCSPQTWMANDVFEDLKVAIEANTLALRTKDSRFDLSSEENKYFIVDVSTGNEVRFLNSRNWTYSYEVNPSEGPILIASPVGNQQGLGILGFCYTPYHFVYDLKYPVLVQVSKGTEIFQFPMAVVIRGNNPRQPLPGTAVDLELPELCTYKNTPVNVRVYDTDLRPVDADIYYQCFGTTCDIGQTENGVLNGDFPQCANGYIVAKSEGFEDGKYLQSTINPGSADVILDRIYDKNVELTVDGVPYNGEAIVTFSGEAGSRTILYPSQKEIGLSEGSYTVQVSIYRNSSLVLEGTTYEQCVDVPAGGVGGFFGFTRKNCYDVDIPEQIVSSVIAGGGTQNYYILESELRNSNTVLIDSDSLPLPRTVDDLQFSYALFDQKGLGVSFR